MSKYVFVIGAGASKEVDLPDGEELMKQIVKLLVRKPPYRGNNLFLDKDFDDLFRRYLSANDKENSGKKLLEACQDIVNGLAPGLTTSIDQFIHTHGEDYNIAVASKIAISQAILQAENNSSLHGVQEKFNSGQWLDPDSWHYPFYKMMTNDYPVTDWDRLKARFADFSLIIFNYDRCIEHFLFHAIQAHLRVTAAEAAELIDQINIVHPYGQTGYLPWQKKGPGEKKKPTVEFGQYESVSPEVIRTIQTFTEGRKDKLEMPKIRSAFDDHSIITFLGFAYHHLNIQLIQQALRSNPRANPKPKILGTWKGTSEQYQLLIPDLVRFMSNQALHTFVDKTCIEFINIFDFMFADH